MFKIFEKIISHFKNKTLKWAIIRYINYRLYGKHDVPIGDDYFGSKAEIYDCHRKDDGYWIAENDSLIYFFKRYSDIKSVLDAPFGTGRFMPIYQEYEFQVTALDTSMDMINQAIRKYPDGMSGVSVLINSLDNIPLADNSVDAVVCYRFLPWIVTFAVAEKSLREISRICRKYAVLELCVGGHNDGHSTVDPSKTMWNRMNLNEIYIWLSGFNLKVSEVKDIYDDEDHPGLKLFICEKSGSN